ncbi:hypothetical protein D081_1103 [Anaerovibrio sp. JC8]|uniref:glycosyltransferase n=1 Tax=Anaerovibrio sp. JC8 TaxID=1240085 RepID=UPI000A0E521F|nr:glycosyltransferase [Anaerovibrio sp. JC8]ORU00580.1 hypothetical protein D081_1103 [Anaerovibrio sp. JC8]
MGIKISACTITKNEEKNMPRWLECMQAIADEIIVVDTGSTDNTVAIAQSAGVNVYHFKWINDFAAAKNYALEQATGDWILFLDADESFTPEAQKLMREELERFHRDKTVGCLLCRMLDVDADNDYRVFNTALLPRIFRCSPYIRYKGAIHEQVENRQGNKKMVFAEKLEFIHTGYSSSIVKLKTERNLPILLSELDKATTEKERRRLYPYLMDAYNTLGDHDKVLLYAKKCISTGYRMIGAEGHFYEVMTMSMYNAKKPLSEVFSALDEAEAAFPEEPFFHFVRAMALEEQEDYLGAEKATLKGLKLREAVEEKLRCGIGVSDTSRGFLPYAYERLGKIYAMKGDKQQAADNYILALKNHKYQTDALKGLCLLLLGSDDIELIQLLNSFFDREKDGNFLVRTLKGCVSTGVMAYYGKSVKDYNEGFVYMAGGRFDSGAVKLGQRYKELSQLGVLSAYNMDEFPVDGYIDTLIGNQYREKLLDKSADEGTVLKRLKEYRIRIELDDISFPEDSMPLVSIMIPTYNRPELFERTLMSAINQSYPNVEILVNDNSTNDDTEVLMDKYSGVVNVHFFRNKEAKTKAENFMTFEHLATGKYLQWCMDDDLLAENKLSKMVPVLRDNPNITVVSSVRGIIDANDELIDSSTAIKLPIPANDEYGYFYGEDMARQMLLNCKNLLGEPSAVLFRRNDLTHHYWQAEAKGYKTISDVAMWCELLEKGHAVVFKKPLSYYRRHDNQEGQQEEVILLSRLEWMKLITNYYEQGVFIKNHADYKKALMALYNEYVNKFSNNEYLRQAANFVTYKEAMELIVGLV